MIIAYLFWLFFGQLIYTLTVYMMQKKYFTGERIQNVILAGINFIQIIWMCSTQNTSSS